MALLYAFIFYDMSFRPENLQAYVADDSIYYSNRIWAAPLWKAIPATLINFTPTILVCYAYWRLSRLFIAVRRGNILVASNAQHVYVFAVCSFIGYFTAPILHWLVDLFVILGTDLRSGGIQISIDGTEIPFFLNFAAFVVISWMLKEGVKMARENEEFI